MPTLQEILTKNINTFKNRAPLGWCQSIGRWMVYFLALVPLIAWAGMTMGMRREMERNHKKGASWMSYFMNSLGILVCGPIFICGAQSMWRKCGLDYVTDYAGYSDLFYNKIEKKIDAKKNQLENGTDYEAQKAGVNQVHAEEKLGQGKGTKDANYGELFSEDRNLGSGNPNPMRTDDNSNSVGGTEMQRSKPVTNELRETKPAQPNPPVKENRTIEPTTQVKELKPVANDDSGDLDGWNPSEKVDNRESNDKLNMSENKGLVG